ncbi:hypothetical protein [Streptomyces sp. NPDC059814]|uniref:hypothetical protein n=1 Tax=unclassified Streptomyces TaxID=2593676 RepID=UPI00365F4E00
MDEITVRIDRQLYSFDGRVLEIFGLREATERFHVKYMYIDVAGPNRKGVMEVRLCHGHRDAPAGSHGRTYDAAEWAALAPLLHTVQSAIDDAAAGR